MDTEGHKQCKRPWYPFVIKQPGRPKQDEMTSQPVAETIDSKREEHQGRQEENGPQHRVFGQKQFDGPEGG